MQRATVKVGKQCLTFSERITRDMFLTTLMGFTKKVYGSFVLFFKSMQYLNAIKNLTR